MQHLGKNGFHDSELQFSVIRPSDPPLSRQLDSWPTRTSATDTLTNMEALGLHGRLFLLMTLRRAKIPIRP
jgi:hypothetical protein